MKYEWDEAKNRSNFVKHGLDFADAKQVLSGPCVTFVDDRFDYGGETANYVAPARWSSRRDCAHAAWRRGDAHHLHEKGKST
jgi:uncharacterized DUF497 family protein